MMLIESPTDLKRNRYSLFILSDRIGVSLIVFLNISHGASMLADRPILGSDLY